MEQQLSIDATEFTPAVELNAGTGKLSFTGKSMPEDVGGFFNPISEWVKEYVNNPQQITELNIFFEYYNSSSARKMIEIIFDLEELANQGKEVKVIWSYAKGDVVMKENGEELSSVVSIPITLQER